MATRDPSLVPEVATELCRVKLEGGSLRGYKCEILIENLSERELKTYKCPRCESIMKDGVISNTGDQVCKYCLSDTEESLFDAPVRATILSLRCSCPLSKRGCDWLGTLGTVEDHLTTCGHVNVSCELMCGVETTRGEMGIHLREECPQREEACLHCSGVHKMCEMEEHVKVCGKVELMCELGCGTRVCRDGMLCHRENECPKEIVVCPYQKYQCEVVGIKRDALEQHLAENRIGHLELKLNSTEEEILLKFRTENEMQIQKLQRMAMKIENLEEKNLSLIKRNEQLETKLVVIEKEIHVFAMLLESKEDQIDFLKRTNLIREMKTFIWKIKNILTYFKPNRESYMNPFSDEFVVAGYHLFMFETDAAYFIFYFQIIAPYDRLEWPFKAIFITRVISHQEVQNPLIIKSPIIEIQIDDGIKRIGFIPLSTDLSAFIKSGRLDLEVTLRILEI